MGNDDLTRRTPAGQGGGSHDSTDHGAAVTPEDTTSPTSPAGCEAVIRRSLTVERVGMDRALDVAAAVARCHLDRRAATR